MNNLEKLEEIKQRRIQLEQEEKDLLSKLKSEKLPIERIFEFVDKKNWSFGISDDYDYTEDDIVYYLDYIGDISELFCKFDISYADSNYTNNMEICFYPNQMIVECSYLDGLLTVIKENNLQIIKKDFEYIEREIKSMENELKNYKDILEKVKEI